MYSNTSSHPAVSLSICFLRIYTIFISFSLLFPLHAPPSLPQVGLAVDHDAVPKMIIKYQALLDKLASSDMPPTAQYRINVEKIARYRIMAAQSNLDDPEKVEEMCNCGQVEELVIQAENEMIVMDMYLRNRWWELVKPVEVEYDPGHVDGGHGDIEWGDVPGGEGSEKK